MANKLRFQIHSGFELEQNSWFFKALLYIAPNKQMLIIKQFQTKAIEYRGIILPDSFYENQI